MSGKLAIIDIISLLVGGYGFAQTVRFPADFHHSFLLIADQQYPWKNCGKRVFFPIYTPDVKNTLVSHGNTALINGKEGCWTSTTWWFDTVFHYYQLVIDSLAVPKTADRVFRTDNFRTGIKTPAEDQDFYQPKNMTHGEVGSYWCFSKINKPGGATDTNLSRFFFRIKQ